MNTVSTATSSSVAPISATGRASDGNQPRIPGPGCLRTTGMGGSLGKGGSSGGLGCALGATSDSILSSRLARSRIGSSLRTTFCRYVSVWRSITSCSPWRSAIVSTPPIRAMAAAVDNSAAGTRPSPRRSIQLAIGVRANANRTARASGRITVCAQYSTPTIIRITASR